MSLHRYKNGKRIPDNHVKYFQYPYAKIESTDPDDEGTYQFIARNDYGEDAVNSFYLHVNMTDLIKNVPSETKCYPMNNNGVFVTFKKDKEHNMIQFLMASDRSPREFIAEFHHGVASENFTIVREKQTKDFLKPLKKFYLYMRNLQPTSAQPDNYADRQMMFSRLSKPVICSTQGFEPKFSMKSDNGIYFTWNYEQIDMNITRFHIELQINEGNEFPPFEKELIGTFEKMPTQWSGNDTSFETIRVIKYTNITRKDGTKYARIELPGNVTGMYAVNARSLSVRILGSTQESGELFDQDLRYLYWYNVTYADFASVKSKSISFSEIESRSVRVSWKGVESDECMRLCAQKRVIIRPSQTDNQCEKM